MKVVEDRSYRLRGTAPAVAAIRLVVEELQWDLPPAVLSRVLVQASELMTSAIAQAGNHADDWVGIEVSASPWKLRSEVSCAGAAKGRYEHPATWCSAILDDLSDDWGFIRDDDGNMVRLWFELDPSQALPLRDGPVEPYVDV